MKVALIGSGRIGAYHAACIRQQPDVTHLSVCDPDRAAGARLGAAVAATVYDDAEQMVSIERPDVVHVCTPPLTHAPLVELALQAGANVLVEKPMALGSAEVARIAAALRDSRGSLCIDHNFLFEPEMQAALEWIQEGRIGEVVGAEMFFGVDTLAPDGGLPPWADGLPGGRFTDLLPHPLYLIGHLLGEVQGATVRIGRIGSGNLPTEFGALLECRRGFGVVRLSLASAPWELGLVIRGTSGTIRVNFAEQRAIVARLRPASSRLSALGRMAFDAGWQTMTGVAGRLIGKATGRLRGYPGMRILIERFYRSLREGLPPPVGFADGARVTEALERVRQGLDNSPRPPKAVILPVRQRA